MPANKPITIGSTTVRPGEQVSIELPVADLYTGTSLSMPVKVICGRRAGPVLFVSAAIHGDELNGVEIIRKLLKRKALASLRGTLLAAPVVNIHGFLDLSRYLPDRRDLNRSFPGSAKGSIAGRLAHTFVTEIVDNADYGIDLHTGAINRSNLPQVRANLGDPTTLELAKAFGAPVILNSTIRDGSLRQCASERGFPMLLYEAGEALRFDEISIRAGLQGVLRIMRHLGMLPSAKTRSKAEPVIAESSSWIRAPTSGVVSHRVSLGTRVITDQRLAVIGDPLAEFEVPVKAKFDGIVIGQSNLPLAHEGDALFHVAAFKRLSKAELNVDEFVASHSDQTDQDTL